MSPALCQLPAFFHDLSLRTCWFFSHKRLDWEQPWAKKPQHCLPESPARPGEGGSSQGGGKSVRAGPPQRALALRVVFGDGCPKGSHRRTYQLLLLWGLSWEQDAPGQPHTLPGWRGLTPRTVRMNMKGPGMLPHASPAPTPKALWRVPSVGEQRGSNAPEEGTVRRGCQRRAPS